MKPQFPPPAEPCRYMLAKPGGWGGHPNPVAYFYRLDHAWRFQQAEAEQGIFLEFYVFNKAAGKYLHEDEHAKVDAAAKEAEARGRYEAAVAGEIEAEGGPGHNEALHALIVAEQALWNAINHCRAVGV